MSILVCTDSSETEENEDKVEDDSNFLRTENFQRDFQPKVEEMVKTIAKLESQIAKYEMRFIALERKQH